MFENCSTLGELNAERIKLSSEGHPLVELNNAYNKRRQEILSSRKPYVELRKIVPAAFTPTQYSGIPVAGYNSKAGTITLTPKGFLI